MIHHLTRDLSTLLLSLSLSYQRFFLPSLTSSRFNDSGVNKVGVPPPPPTGRRGRTGGRTRTRRSHAISSLLRRAALRVLFCSPMGEREGRAPSGKVALFHHLRLLPTASLNKYRMARHPVARVGWREDTTRSHSDLQSGGVNPLGLYFLSSFRSFPLDQI